MAFLRWKAEPSRRVKRGSPRREGGKPKAEGLDRRFGELFKVENGGAAAAPVEEKKENSYSDHCGDHSGQQGGIVQRIHLKGGEGDGEDEKNDNRTKEGDLNVGLTREVGAGKGTL